MNPNYTTSNNDARNRYNLWNVTYILMIVATVISAWAVIPLAWLIPMTIATKNARNEVSMGVERNHMALAVCCLLFAWFVPGIVAIIAASQTPVPQFNQRQF